MTPFEIMAWAALVAKLSSIILQVAATGEKPTPEQIKLAVAGMDKADEHWASLAPKTENPT